MSDLLFDDDDFGEVIDPSLEYSRKLVVGAPCEKPEDLNVIEEQYRREGVPPVMFIEQDEGLPETLGNAVEFAKAMGLAPGAVPTLEAAQTWLDAQRWPTW